MEIEREIVDLMTEYFNAANNQDIEKMWELIYNPVGDDDYHKNKLIKDNKDFFKYKMQFTLLGAENIQLPQAKFDADQRYKDAYFADLVYKIGDWEKKDNAAFNVVDGKIRLNVCKRI